MDQPDPTGREMTHPLMFFRLLIAAFLLCLGAQHAFAQKVLLLTTNVTEPNAENPDAVGAYENLQNEFASALANPSDLTKLSVLGNPNAISQATFTAASGSPYDIVIVAATYKPIDPHQLGSTAKRRRQPLGQFHRFLYRWLL
ncbi:hypothetical protein [Comamonas sp.]|uniref:hypothetical protein n=1 Tax=Comamonas sp. TaxID=34028 RepID=UPI00289D69B6|nr:hypothetical protein [Comamonas sp.]